MTSQELSLPLDQPLANEDIFLLGLLVQANTHENGWHHFLEVCCEHFQLNSCHLYVSAATELSPTFQEYAGAKASEWELVEYIDKYFATDYTHQAILSGNPHTWYASNLMPDQEKIRNAPAYCDWAARNGIQDVSGTILFRIEGFSCAFVHNKNFGHPTYSENDMARFSALSPYIAQAMRTRFELSRVSEDGDFFKAAINKLKVPTALLSEFSELITMNNAMQAFARDNTSVRLVPGSHLGLDDSKAELAIRFAITQTIASSKNIDLPYETSLVELTLANGDSVFLSVDAISEGDAEDAFRGALVYVLSKANIVSITPERLKRLFSLSQAEAEVCAQFLHNVAPKEIAHSLNKSVHTVREQLDSVYKKVGVSNQMQLVSLLNSLPA
ncbi:helix-turn-helix transcriptional regulator [Gilvimarinus sp. SDUM040013]|uniref:Helix-turn-helix transcriptional regulator n=1 Tax=Gilvimarinus gilvus TaxID=3058038 RepID=A0ABU4RV10_9GAMM|nr:helix-turn-helix transcriptional regulator [Gilvimarinus sp. SDUM040013]MDO3387915.1 helix-turn-helix transcriptional regulator [Gilvimarinus sp. SDUM040013]MDX6848714.1 helix-turn-helix transcriptional regulator [Gilvimarinus sp. SDUM040013]